MKTAIAPPQLRTLAIAGTDERFPVNRVFCVGKNYAAHAREMGSDPEKEPPFFFMKPAQAVVDASRPIEVPYPPGTTDYQHEVELVIAIGVGGLRIAPERALEHVFGSCVGLDMTRRDLQRAAKKLMQPWEFAKSFTGSAPMGVISRVADVGHLERGDISLTLNGVTKQQSDLSQRTWSVAACIARLSEYEPLEPGDLIMTGTPEGVGPVVVGDVMIGRVAGLQSVEVKVGAPR